jgi:catechol 2,3-dioxygenase-like lactoylglutathione lyase family enzyme
MSANLPIKVKSLDHVTIISSDLEATRKFYVDGLGMEEVARPAFDFPGLWFQAGATQIHVTLESPESGKAGWGDRGVQIPSRGHHFAFEVDDAIAATETARALGFQIAREPKSRPDGAIQVYFDDPDGHVVELFSGP